jgi:hypothetical protein
MTQPLSNLTARLAYFEKQIFDFEQRANTLASPDGDHSEETINMIQFEFSEFRTEKKSLQEEVKKIISSIEHPLQSALRSTFHDVMDAYRDLKERLNIGYETCERFRELNELHNRCVVAVGFKNNDSLDKIKERSIEILSTYAGVSCPDALSASELNEMVQVQNSIEKYQSGIISEHLKELYRLTALSLDNPIEKNRHIGKMIDIFHKELPSSCALGSAVRDEIITQVRDTILPIWGVDPDDLYVSRTSKYDPNVPIFNHLPELLKILSLNPLLSATSGEEMPALQEPGEAQPVVKEENQHPTFDIGLGNAMIYRSPHPVPSELTSPGDWIAFAAAPSARPEVTQPQKNVIKELDLPSLRSEIVLITLSSDLSAGERTAKINKVLDRLSKEARCSLDGKVYDLSTDPKKGGDGWGGKHAAEDPDLLLQAINELSK